jgi:hypothetical protein
MEREENVRPDERDERVGELFETPDPRAPETAEHPAPGVEHEREPNAENIMPAEDRPGTF